MKVSHSALPRGPVSHLGGVHNPSVAQGQGPAAHGDMPNPAVAPSDIASQLAAISSQPAMKAP